MSRGEPVTSFPARADPVPPEFPLARMLGEPKGQQQLGRGDGVKQIESPTPESAAHAGVLGQVLLYRTPGNKSHSKNHYRTPDKIRAFSRSQWKAESQS